MDGRSGIFVFNLKLENVFMIFVVFCFKLLFVIFFILFRLFGNLNVFLLNVLFDIEFDRSWCFDGIVSSFFDVLNNLLFFLNFVVCLKCLELCVLLVLFVVVFLYDKFIVDVFCMRLFVVFSFAARVSFRSNFENVFLYFLCFV